MFDAMNACCHKLSILNRHDSEQISRANLLRIAWKHATTVRVEADCATGSVSNVISQWLCRDSAARNRPHRQPVSR